LVIEKRFEKTKGVTVFNSPTPRKYYSYGKNLIGFSHGNNERKDSLPLIMSREAKEYWGSSDYIEFHRGHIHKQKNRIFTTVDEEMGIVERSLPSLTSRDDWHTLKGYGHLRESQALFYDKSFGNIGIIKYRPEFII
jgi:hypothetical protein